VPDPSRVLALVSVARVVIVGAATRPLTGDELPDIPLAAAREELAFPLYLGRTRDGQPREVGRASTFIPGGAATRTRTAPRTARRCQRRTCPRPVIKPGQVRLRYGKVGLYLNLDSTGPLTGDELPHVPLAAAREELALALCSGRGRMGWACRSKWSRRRGNSGIESAIKDAIQLLYAPTHPFLLLPLSLLFHLNERPHLHARASTT
jgi:hypothetical protein